MKQHIISFSTGLSSALTAERVIERYGAEPGHTVHIVFMDVGIEDEDNYRFLADMERRWGHLIIRLAEGRTPYQVARDRQIIPNQKIAPCTAVLKIAPFMAYLEQFPADQVVIHIGYDYTERHRCDATSAGYGARGWQVEYPLLWKPYEYRPYDQVCRDDWGIEPPRMYTLGYRHANCGGCCVKQGQKEWLRTLVNFPMRYLAAEQWEQEMRDHPTRKDYALLRDAKGGTVRAMTLRELRERYEAQPASLFDADETPACFSCGIGAVTLEAA